MRLHDKPLAASDEDAEAGSSDLSAKDLKKLRSKQRRAEKKAQESKKGEKRSSAGKNCGVMHRTVSSYYLVPVLPYVRAKHEAKASLRVT